MELERRPRSVAVTSVVSVFLTVVVRGLREVFGVLVLSVDVVAVVEPPDRLDLLRSDAEGCAVCRSVSREVVEVFGSSVLSLFVPLERSLDAICFEVRSPLVFPLTPRTFIRDESVSVLVVAVRVVAVSRVDARP